MFSSSAAYILMSISTRKVCHLSFFTTNLYILINSYLIKVFVCVCVHQMLIELQGMDSASSSCQLVREPIVLAMHLTCMGQCGSYPFIWPGLPSQVLRVNLRKIFIECVRIYLLCTIAGELTLQLCGGKNRTGDMN